MLAIAAIAMVGVLAGACTAPGQITLRGPWTVPLPPIDTTGPSTTVPVIPGLCETVYTPSGFRVSGATVTVPAISINLTGTIDVPNVLVSIPAAVIALPSLQVNCLQTGLLTLAVDLVIPATVQIADAHLDLNTGVLTLVNPSVTINGVGLSIPDLGGLTIPISLTIPIDSVTIPLN
jgi:hypothetical protein